MVHDAPRPPRPPAHPPALDRLGFSAWAIAIAVVADLTLFILWRIEWRWLALLHLGVFGVLTFGLFGLDKWRAKRNGRRVSEGNLLLLTILGGAAGSLAAMALFRHKTQRWYFRVVALISLFVHVTAVGYLFLSS